MSEAQSRTSPIVAIAAVAVILFSAVGIAVMTGIMPSSFSKNSESQVAGKADAPAGHEIEKQVKKTLRYDVVVRLEDGTSRTFPYQAEPAFRPGDKVKIVDGTVVAD